MPIIRQIRQCGITLVELVVSIVVISVGLAGILLVMERNTAASADPIIQHQAVAIAEAYLEEILAKDFVDPDGTNSPGGVPETRATFDNVEDYDGLTDNGARDQDDNPIAGLGQYVVGMQVENASLNGAVALLVTVTVAPPGGADVSLSGYRTDY